MSFQIIWDIRLGFSKEVQGFRELWRLQYNYFQAFSFPGQFST